MGKVLKVKPKFDPRKDDQISARVRLSEHDGWIYLRRCQSIKEARMLATAYGENVEYKITVNGIVKEHHKIQKGYFPGRISSAQLPTLGKGRP